MIGQRPPWNYGHWTSFGVWTKALDGDRILVLLYKGALVHREHDFKFKVVASETTEDGGDEEGLGFKVDVREQIHPSLKVAGPAGAVFGKDDFPLYVFISDDNVICTKEDMKTWRKLADVSETEFYSLVSGQGPIDFDLPELDETVYDTETDEDMTKAGLAVPIWRLNVRQVSGGGLILSEILDIRCSDTYRFNPRDDEEDKDEEEEKKIDPCKPEDGVDESDKGTSGDGGGRDDIKNQEGGVSGGEGDVGENDDEGVPC